MPQGTTTSGRVTRHLLRVPQTDIALPYTQIDGEEQGPTLLVTGGVHGGEYPGIEAAIRFAQALDPSRLKGRVYVIHLSNPPAFYGKSQYIVPLDGKNLNRVFPGSLAGSVSERMAHVVSELAQSSDFWVDMHGGDIHEALIPFTIYSDGGFPEVVEQSRKMAQAYGISHILESDSVAGGTYAFAAAAGIPAILTESGQMGQLDEEAVQVHLRGLDNILRVLGMVAEPVKEVPAPTIYRKFVWSRAPQEGLFYRSIVPGQWVHAGEIGGVMKNAYGDVLAEIPVPQDGLVLFTATSLAINFDDPLFAVAAE